MNKSVVFFIVTYILLINTSVAQENLSVGSEEYLNEVDKFAIINPDGSKTFNAGVFSQEINESRNSFCAQFGMVDVTNEHTITIGKNSSDGILCNLPVNNNSDVSNEKDSVEKPIYKDSINELYNQSEKTN